MRYVYLLQSAAFVGECYVGVTSDLRRRLRTIMLENLPIRRSSLRANL